ncbi:MAG: minor extracellular serine protease Vpr [Thermoanaerobaculia bacterium]|jgi:subtilisin family serine protease|nr:minor extracellular serine protease Vpr [Thermoanaerobaculia bacterium]
MRHFAMSVFVFAAASVAAAQFAPDAGLRVEMRDGTSIAVPRQAEETYGQIVEFVAPPAARSAGKSAVDYQATFARFRDDLGAILNANRAGKSAIVPEIRREYFVVFNGVAIDVPNEAIAQIRALPYVKRVESDRAVHAFASTNIAAIGADKVWTTLGSRGRGVTVAIIDTGIDYMHPALGGGFGAGFKVIGGWDFVNNDADPFDDAGHGTHVAGIVAGDSATITGVAPDASLIAYKVLGANGSGSDSNVMAAVERAADPNGDGNTSDHADIANLSLGGGGNPDDPLSVAVDNATAAGVTFAIAAGNNAAFHSIASPGTARSAITVGATDVNDAITSFSSRGPNTKNMAIKPDVVAPGLSILSSYPGNRYASLSGTSMATPHVAGAAALLKSLHHDWTPAQIKLALMNNAALLHDEIMAGGEGRIDVYASATRNLVIDPPSISIGLAPSDAGSWTASRTLHLTNRGTQAQTYSVKSNVSLGEVVTPSAASVTVPAGGSSDVSFTFAIDNAKVMTSASSFTGGGQIVLTNTSAPADIRNIQFAFTKAARTTAHFDRAYPDALWVNASRTNTANAIFVDDNTSEALMLPGIWDMLIWTTEVDAKTNKTTATDFVAREKLTLAGDTLIAIPAAGVAHKITFAGQRENGKALTGNGYANSGRILLDTPSGGIITALSFPWTASPLMYVSDLSDQKTLLFYETVLDNEAHDYYMVQHPPLTGVTADATLTTGGSALRGGIVRIGVPAASRGDRRLTALATNPAISAGTSATGIVDAPIVTARVFVSPDVHPSYTNGIAFIAITDALTQYTTPLLRVMGDRLVSVGAGSLLPWTYSGSTYEYGLGPRFPLLTFSTPGGTSRLSMTTEMLGPLGEYRIADRVGTATAIFDANGTRLSNSGYSTSSEVTAAPARYRIEVINLGTLYPGVNKTTTATVAIDSSRPDYFPPTLTTMMLLDGSGKMVTHLDPHGSGALLFSAADSTASTSASGRTYQQIAGDATKVSYRYAGEIAWRPLTATQVIEDSASGAGILYRINLAEVTNTDRAMVDLKFELADPAGNTTIVTMAPAFSVGPELLPRHRATR